MLEFSNNSLSSSCHIFDDLNITPNFKFLKILNYGVKSRKCVKIKGKKNFTSLILLTSNNFEPKKKRVSRFGRSVSFLDCGKLLTSRLSTNNEFSIVFNLLENSTGPKKKFGGLE